MNFRLFFFNNFLCNETKNIFFSRGVIEYDQKFITIIGQQTSCRSMITIEPLDL